MLPSSNGSGLLAALAFGPGLAEDGRFRCAIFVIRDAPVDVERGELTRLRREVRALRMERDILKKATAFFARQSE